MDAPNEAYEVKKLDAYVLMMAEIRKLRIAEIINDYISRDPRSKISAGEAVEALIMLILTGDHTLYRVKSVLSELDLEVIFGRKGIKAEYFHDDRLGAVLDALHYVGLSQIFGSVSLQAIYIHHLDTSILSEDTTSISFEGVYEDSALVANGFSKDHRPDLKQVLFGITVTQDGGIPIIGRVTKGNQSDSTEVRIQLSLLEKYLPDVKDYLFVGDSKIMSGETIAAVKANNAHFLTLLPSTFSIKKELLSMDKPMNLLLKKQGKKGQMETYKGFSVTEDYEYLPGESTELKFLVVHSTVLNRKKRKTLENLVKKEKAELIKFVKKKEKREYYCEKDATVAREALMKAKKPKFYAMEMEIECHEKQKGRGRPRKDGSTEMKKTWQLKICVKQDKQKITKWLDENSKFVLVTDRTSLSDEEMLGYYKDQYKVELDFRWIKSPAKISPIFLKKDERIEALGLIYLLALQVYALLQREVRKRLKEAGETLPGNKGETSIPTTQALFRQMTGIYTITVKKGGEKEKVLVGWNEMHAKICKFAGFEEGLYETVVSY